MTDPITVQGDLAAVVQDIRSNTTLRPIYACGTDEELTAALRDLPADELTVLMMYFGLGRPKGKISEIKAALPSVNGARSADEAAGNRLSELLEARVLQRIDAEPHELHDFALMVRVMLINAGIRTIPAGGMFTAEQCEQLIVQQEWAARHTRSFNVTLSKRPDHRTLEELIHLEQL